MQALSLRVPSFGAIVGPTLDREAWEAPTNLSITYRPTYRYPLAAARRFADGLSSWLLRQLDGAGGLAVFDRPAGSERDLVVHFYELSDETGKIWVITERGAPSKGARVGAVGKYINGVVWGGRNFGSALRETDRKVR